MSQMGPVATELRYPRHVCSSPNRRHVMNDVFVQHRRCRSCPNNGGRRGQVRPTLSATTGPTAPQQQPDYSITSSAVAKQRLRDAEAERLSGREVDNQFELGWLFDRNIAGLRPA
jgi:hypothetical protein